MVIAVVAIVAVIIVVIGIILIAAVVGVIMLMIIILIIIIGSRIGSNRVDVTRLPCSLMSAQTPQQRRNIRIGPTSDGPDAGAFELRGSSSRKPPMAFVLRALIDERLYMATYQGHGQSKTVYRLALEGAPHHGRMLKVTPLTETPDPEPAVCRLLSQKGLATRIYDERVCEEVDKCGKFVKKWHCWVTESAIPLDEHMKKKTSDQSRCILRTSITLLRAAQECWIVNDSGLYNFGIKLDETDGATEPSIVINDVEPSTGRRRASVAT